ncbi:hypothetical protein HZA42_05120 [Candidatus Peregrinibacteria bacterium]|nr:hypothetical protein [Candidatus Peregrinibacteria bacterium]
MGKHNKFLQAHHLYLGMGGLLAVSALVVALTFGLSNAQTPPPGDTGTYMPPPTNTYTPPTNTYTPPTDTYTPPTNTYTPPTNTYTPPTDTYTPPTNTYTPPTNTYTPPTNTYTPPPTTSGTYINMPDCAAGVMPTAASPCKMPPPPSCPSGQWYDFSKSACTSSTTGTYPQAGTTGTYPPPTGGAICSATSKFPNVAPPSNQDCYGNPVGGGMTGSTNNMWCPALNRNSTPQECGDATPVCGPNEYPTSQKPCKPQPGTQYNQQPYTNNQQGQYPSADDTRTTGLCADPRSGKSLMDAGEQILIKDCYARGGNPYFGQTTLPDQQGQGQYGQQDKGQYRPAGDQGRQGQYGQPGGYPGSTGNQQFSQPGPQPMFQPPMYGIFGAPPMGPQGQNGQFGAQDEERMKQQQAQQEEQFKKMQEQQVKQIKKDLSRMKKEIDRVRKQLDKVTVTDNTPEEIVTAKQALTEIDASMTEVDTCSGDGCFDIMPTVGPLMQDIMNPDVMNALQRIKEGPKFAKRLVAEVNKTMKKAASVAKSLSKKAEKIKDSDVRDAVAAEIDAAKTQCSTLAAQVIDVANGGDIESAALSVESELNDACDAVSDLTWKIDGFLNKQQVVKSIAREVKSLTGRLAKFQKDIQKNRFNGDLDAVSQLAVSISKLSANLDDIKREKDIDTLGDLFDDAAGLISDAEEFVQDAQVQNIANRFDMFKTQVSPVQGNQGGYIDESNPSPAP